MLTKCHTLSHRLAKLLPKGRSFVPQGAGRPENAPAEVRVIAHVVTAVVRAIRRTIRRGTVGVVVHPGRARRRPETNPDTIAPNPGTWVHTHRHCRRHNPFPILHRNPVFSLPSKKCFVSFLSFFWFCLLNSFFPSSPLFLSSRAPLSSRHQIPPDKCRRLWTRNAANRMTNITTIIVCVCPSRPPICRR